MGAEGAYDDANDRDPYAEDCEPDDDPDRPAPPYWFAGQHLPPDAQRMGLTHHVPEGAILDFAGRLNSAKLGHRVTAWALLALFGLPVVFSALRVLYLW